MNKYEGVLVFLMIKHSLGSNLTCLFSAYLLVLFTWCLLMAKECTPSFFILNRDVYLLCIQHFVSSLVLVHYLVSMIYRFIVCGRKKSYGNENQLFWLLGGWCSLYVFLYITKMIVISSAFYFVMLLLLLFPNFTYFIEFCHSYSQS